MSLLMALALSIGVLIAAWTFIALGSLALPVWAGIIAWGAFFAAGGKGDGLLKTIASTLSGVFWAFIALTLNARFGGNAAVLPILVGAAAFVMVAQSKVSLLSFIPGSFLGAATAVGVVVGSNSTWSKVIIALVAGAVFGWLSERLAGVLAGSSTAAAAERARAA
ncbi:MAG TPA: DUF1097 domain-containing protein [Gemmatimonadales bacterium]|nr:DUF1097 domain-containing protein [Gemmatimonadales bacterium]